MKKTMGFILLMIALIIVIGTFMLNISAANSVIIPWDWSGVIGTGQSLAVGAQASPVVSIVQPFNNLKLSLGSFLVPPFDSESNQLSMKPLVEPIRQYATTYPGPYPGNIYGETPHTSMANQITSLVKEAAGEDYITAHTVVGESGQGMVALQKGAIDNGSTGRAYAASIFEVEAINKLAKKSGKTYGVGAVILTHGETDCGSSAYESQIRQMWLDYNQDIKSITGQSQDVKLITTQQHSVPNSGTAVGVLAQWLVGVNNPGDIVCAGPNYYYPYDSDGIHLNASGYQQLGEKYGKVYYETVVNGENWQPLQPTDVTASGKVIKVKLHVPVAPLVWDTTLGEPNQNVAEWKNGKGFEVTSSTGTKITINSVEISGDSVIINCANNINADTLVGYAYTAQQAKRSNGTVRWGLLRDSDPFIGYNTKIAQPNYCVSFQMPVSTAVETSQTITKTSNPITLTPTTPTTTTTTTTNTTSTPGNIGADKYSISYNIQNDWGSGSTVSVKIENNGISTIDGWILSWEFSGNQKITNLWNGTYTQTGSSVTIRNAAYNGTIPVNGSVSFGFNLTYSGLNDIPIGFTIK